MLLWNNLRNIFRTVNGPTEVLCRQYSGAAGLAKKKKLAGKAGPVAEKKVIPVETDAVKLVNYVCGSNYMQKGEDIKIKPDSEYPDWLWTLPLGGPKPLEELDPETKEYWRRLRRSALRRNNKMLQLRKF